MVTLSVELEGWQPENLRSASTTRKLEWVGKSVTLEPLVYSFGQFVLTYIGRIEWVQPTRGKSLLPLGLSKLVLYYTLVETAIDCCFQPSTLWCFAIKNL